MNEAEWPDQPLTPETLATAIEAICPSSLAAHLDRDRPYNGQPHTDHGTRGQTEIRGITMRDLADCFMRACFEASGLPIERWPGSVYDLPWADMDIIAVRQNMNCWVERYMGIYPNVPELVWRGDDVEPPQ